MVAQRARGVYFNLGITVDDCIRAPDEIGRQQGGQHGNGHGNRVKKLARHIQGQAQRSDGERKFADLGHARADPQGSATAVIVGIL